MLHRSVLLSQNIIPNFALTCSVDIREEIFMSTNKVVANALRARNSDPPGWYQVDKSMIGSGYNNSELSRVVQYLRLNGYPKTFAVPKAQADAPRIPDRVLQKAIKEVLG
jgi:hypothetical protein